jgi:hypothetical protein
MTQYEGADKVPALMLANTTPRYQRLEALESWVQGTQYNARACDWFDDKVPLWERKPCIVYPAVSLAIESYVDLMFGEKRFPAFTSKPGEDEGDDEAGLNEEASKILDRFITKHHELSSFPTYCRDGLRAAMGAGTAVGIHGHRDGRPFAELLPAKWGTPVLDAHGKVLAIEIRYPYVDEYRKADGKWAVRVRLYRRVIDAKSDVTFQPAEAHEDGREPSWIVDTTKSVDHNLGFCPVVWYPFMKGCQPVNVIDGQPIHALTTDEILQHDVARSQWHRCSLLAEPQIVETGVSPGFNPTGTGRAAIVPSTETGRTLSPAEYSQARSGYVVGAAEEARKKGPGYVWSYPDPETKVAVLVTPKDALEAQHMNVSDLRLKVQEALCVVFLDPENIKFAATTSGKALEAIKQKQIDRCGQYRDDVRDRFLLPSIDMQLRIAERVGTDLKVPLIKKALPVLKKFASEAEAPKAA